MVDTDERREEAALALRLLAREGFFPLPFGHLSVRAPEGSPALMLMLRHLHEDSLPIAEVAATDIVAIGPAGEQLEGREAPGERFIHSGVYRARADVACVLHYHSPLTAAFGLASRPLVPRTPLAPILGPSVPAHDYGGQVDTVERGDALAKTLGSAAALTLPGHGAVVVGASVAEVVARAVTLEDACAVERAAVQLGAPPATAADAVPADPHVSEEVAHVVWADLLRLHGQEGRDDG